MPHFVACSDHVVTAVSLESANARADQLNANARADLRLCQNLHIGVEALTGNDAKLAAAKAAREHTHVTG